MISKPSHHIPYLYALAGRSDLTQQRVREVVGANFNATPFGLSGNEDCGQMSAWYIFGALGFYPVNPVSREYVFGLPFFDRLTLHLPIPAHSNPASDSKFYDAETHSYCLTVEAFGAPSTPYVEEIRVNGKIREEPFVRWEEISRGGSIRFEMEISHPPSAPDADIAHEEL
ncbi:family 92 glycosyl hydrolase [Mucidula mucida]|nr:family 92 glycosyl hydrolase [Mucidula mucida]